MTGEDVIAEITPPNFEYDAQKNELRLTIPEDLEEATRQYREYSLFREFVDSEIAARFQATYDHERDVVTGYELAGFLTKHAGQTYRISLHKYMQFSEE